MPRILGKRDFGPGRGLGAGRGASGRAGAHPPAAARVVLLANRNDAGFAWPPARHYAEARGVPADNIIALPLPEAETISWDEFIGQLWQPLRDELVRRRWIDAIRLESFDAMGRRKYAVAGHRIAALVTCRGVPLRIADDPARRRPGEFRREEFRTNEGAVDSELSLLAADGGYPIDSFVPNPLFGRLRPSEFARAKGGQGFPPRRRRRRRTRDRAGRSGRWRRNETA